MTALATIMFARLGRPELVGKVRQMIRDEMLLWITVRHAGLQGMPFHYSARDGQGNVLFDSTVYPPGGVPVTE